MNGTGGLGKRLGERVGIDELLRLGGATKAGGVGVTGGVFAPRDANVQLEVVRPLPKAGKVGSPHNSSEEKENYPKFGLDQDSSGEEMTKAKFGNSRQFTVGTPTSNSLRSKESHIVVNSGIFMARLMGERPDTQELSSTRSSIRESELLRKWVDELSSIPPIMKILDQCMAEFYKSEEGRISLQMSCQHEGSKDHVLSDLSLPEGLCCKVKVQPGQIIKGELQLGWVISLIPKVPHFQDTEELQFQTETFIPAQEGDQFEILSLNQTPLPVTTSGCPDSDFQNSTSIFVKILQINSKGDQILSEIEYFLAY